MTSANGAKTRFLYDGDDLVAEYDGLGTLTRRYVHGPGGDDPVAVYEGPGRGLANRRYMLPDERGSIVALVNADGTPSVINRYDAWGVPAPQNAGRFQYTGQTWIAELGMYYYKARFYSPTLGRFLQVDPVGYEGGINIYAYVGNDPVNRTDASGMADDEEIRRARQTLNRMIGAVQREIRSSQVPAAGSRIQSTSDNSREAGLRNQLSALRSLKAEDLADMRVNPSRQAVGVGLTNAMRGAPAETVFGATRSNGGIAYGRLSQSSRTSDSGQATVTSNMILNGHFHAPGAGREHPGVGDPGNVLTLRVPSIYAQGADSNSIGWNGTRFTLSNVTGAMPSYGAAPDWVHDTFEPW